jgi:hypothetical protein
MTTDAGQACFMFWSVYAFYRYAKSPSKRRLVIVGLAAGMTLASKHSAVLLFPILLLLATAEVVRLETSPRGEVDESVSRRVSFCGGIPRHRTSLGRRSRKQRWTKNV